MLECTLCPLSGEKHDRRDENIFCVVIRVYCGGRIPLLSLHSGAIPSAPPPHRIIEGRASEARVLFADGGQLPHDGAVVPDAAGDALPRQGGRVHGRVGLHRQQLHPLGHPYEQPFQDYKVSVCVAAGARQEEGGDRNTGMRECTDATIPPPAAPIVCRAWVFRRVSRGVSEDSATLQCRGGFDRIRASQGYLPANGPRACRGGVLGPWTIVRGMRASHLVIDSSSTSEAALLTRPPPRAARLAHARLN